MSVHFDWKKNNKPIQYKTNAGIGSNRVEKATGRFHFRTGESDRRVRTFVRAKSNDNKTRRKRDGTENKNEKAAIGRSGRNGRGVVREMRTVLSNLQM